MPRPIEKVLAALQNKGCKPKNSGNGYSAKCPVHEGKDFDSLSVSEGQDGRVLFQCHSKDCHWREVTTNLGLIPRDLHRNEKKKSSQKQPSKTHPGGKREVDEHRYLDGFGNHRFSVIRYQPKQFSQCRPDGDERRVWGLHSGWYERRPNGKNWRPIKGAKNQRARPRPKQKGDQVERFDEVDPILYRLPELMSADYRDWVFVVEGEKDVDNLARHGLIATTCPQGARKWGKVDDSPLQGRNVAILPDNDQDGRDHAQLVARSLIEKSKCVRVVELPELGPKGDVSDWLGVGHTADELLTLVGKATDWVPTEDSPLTLDPQAPTESATIFANRYPRRNGGSALVYHRGSFWFWDGTHYRFLDPDRLDHELYSFLGLGFLADGRPFNPNEKKVKDVIGALRARLYLSNEISPPSWLDGRAEPDRSSLLCCSNGIVDLQTGELIQPTPELFALNSLDYNYDSEASLPERWLRFLHQLWPDDHESILLLQEWFGYCLTADTSLQKILLILGVRRAGKSTIGRILAGLLGKENVAAPSLTDFTTDFGLMTLVDKPLAILPDFRISRRLDDVRALQRLLSISGEDRQTIQIKYRSAWVGTLPTRLVMITNEMPAFPDIAAAFASRLLVLQLTRSWEGEEDTKLGNKVMQELPGILNWSLEGLKRLKEQGCFTEPESSRQGKEEIRGLSSPISRFVEECCEVGCQREVAIDDIFQACVEWCQSEGYDEPRSKQIFGKDLRTIGFSLDTKRRGKGNKSVYVGVSLKA